MVKEKIAALKQHLFIGILGETLTTEESDWLRDLKVGGVILFSRNFSSKKQLRALTHSIKAIRSELLISVDHEGGRVQRFRDQFTKIPPMRDLGELYDLDPDNAIIETERLGQLIATELQEVGVDFSYTPVCDLDYGKNSAIGDRAFHSDPMIVATLVSALHRGLQKSGSIGIAKHFPGHGFVEIDTHLNVAVDPRDLSQLESMDLIPFRALINQGIEGMMPAHIIYPTLDADNTAVSSKIWIDYLRKHLGFNGMIISDDLDMQGANHLGDIHAKVKACFDAGINIVLLCNDFDAIRSILK